MTTWYSADFARLDPSGTDLLEARHNARLKIHEAATLCGYAPRTWSRWERTDRRVPLAAYRLIQAWTGWIPDTAWSGWSVRGGLLWTPEDQALSPGLVRALPYLHQALKELRRMIAARTPTPTQCHLPPWYGAGI